MSLRYGRLFDATVRDEYQRVLAQAKAQLGPVLPGERTQLPITAVTSGNWRNIVDQGSTRRRVLPAHRRPWPVRLCQHLRTCPNFRSEASFLPVLQLQHADAEALAADAAARGWGSETGGHRRSSGGSTCSSTRPMPV
jgi:hypothetical protein